MTAKRKKQSVGRKLKALREQEGLSIEDLAGQVGLKPAYLSGLEADEYLPHVSEILTLARTLSVEASAFMEEGEAKTSRGKRHKAHATRTSDYAYEPLTPFEQDTHLMAFEVSIDSKSEHKKVGYKHDGEEFIYVLSGRLKLSVGRKTRTLGPGQSIRFDSSQKHMLKNPFDEPTNLVVVIYTP